MIHEAGPADRPALEALFLSHIDDAMFPLANLRAHGIGRGDFPSDHRHATRFWALGPDSVIGVTREGLVLPLLGADPDLSDLCQTLSGLPLTGVVGPTTSARPVLAALGLQARPMRVNEDEPGFAISLADLRIPGLDATSLQPLSEANRRLATAWRAAAKVETDGMTPDEVAERAPVDIDHWIAADSHRLLIHDGQPVAMTGFNARLPEVVQIGGVYTPPELRNRGYARTAVALHLAEVRAAGVTRAVLFAATPAACRAYLAIGFRPAAPFTLALFTAPVTIPT